MRHEDAGTAALTTIVMLPLLLVVLVGVLELGALRAVAYRAGAVSNCAQCTQLEHADKDHEQKRQHHDRGQGRGPSVLVPHWLTSPRATAVDRTATLVVKRKGMATCWSACRDTRTGSRHATREGSISTMTRPGSMPTSLSLIHISEP